MSRRPVRCWLIVTLIVLINTMSMVVTSAKLSRGARGMQKEYNTMMRQRLLGKSMKGNGKTKGLKGLLTAASVATNPEIPQSTQSTGGGIAGMPGIAQASGLPGEVAAESSFQPHLKQLRLYRQLWANDIMLRGCWRLNTLELDFTGGTAESLLNQLSGKSCTHRTRPNGQPLGDYRCIFGSQTCPGGDIYFGNDAPDTHPTVVCDCAVGQDNWNCEVFEPCKPAPEEPTEQPIEQVPPNSEGGGNPEEPTEQPMEEAPTNEQEGGEGAGNPEEATEQPIEQAPTNEQEAGEGGGGRKTPSWFKFYRKRVFKDIKLRKCKKEQDVSVYENIQNGKYCKQKKDKPYTCLFGEQTCESGRSIVKGADAKGIMTHPVKKCTCDNNAWTDCEKWVACDTQPPTENIVDGTASAEVPPPLWIKPYRDFIGESLRSCKKMQKLPEGKEYMDFDGSECKPKRSEEYVVYEYTCMFGNKLCEFGSSLLDAPDPETPHPEYKCECENQKWKCEKWQPCDNCPAVKGESCSVPDTQCEFDATCPDGVSTGTESCVCNPDTSAWECTGVQNCLAASTTLAIAGEVKEDVDGDGEGDIPIVGVHMILVSNSEVMATTLTDEEGQYSFEGLNALCCYKVYEDNPTGYSDVGDKDGGDLNMISIDLTNGESSFNNLFVDEMMSTEPSIAPTPAREVSAPASIAGSVVEPPTAPPTEVTPSPSAATTTSPTPLPLGATFSPTDAPTTSSPSLSTAPSEMVLGSISGYVDEAPGTMSFEVIIILKDGSGNVVSSYITGAGASYVFYDLPAGDYIVERDGVAEIKGILSPGENLTGMDFAALTTAPVVPPGVEPAIETSPGVISPPTTSPAELAPSVSPTASPTPLPLGATFAPTSEPTTSSPSLSTAPSEMVLGSISGYVEEAPGTMSFEVIIILKDGSGSVVSTYITGAGASYVFYDLPAGDYIVDRDGVAEIKGILSPGENLTGVNFTEATTSTPSPPLRRIGGAVMEDTNGDDVGDLGMDGIQIVLTHLNGTFVDSMHTDNDGNFLFENLDPICCFRLVSEAPLDGYVDVPNGDESDPNVIVVDVTSSDSLANVFKDRLEPISQIPPEPMEPVTSSPTASPVAMPSPPPSALALGSISGKLAEDTLNNGFELILTLKDAETGEEVASYMAGTDGTFAFDNVPSGDYIIEITGGVVVEVSLAPGEEKANMVIENGSGQPNVPLAEQKNNNVIFEDIPGSNNLVAKNPSGLLGSISGYVTDDVNDDGFAFVVKLINGTGEIVVATVTDSDGYYAFYGLPRGFYGMELTPGNQMVDTYLDEGQNLTYINITNSVDENSEWPNAAPSASSAPSFSVEPSSLTLGLISGYIVGPHNTDVGVWLTLRDDDGEVVTTTISDSNEYYEFRDVPLGLYTIESDYWYVGDQIVFDKNVEIEVDLELAHYLTMQNISLPTVHPSRTIAGVVLEDVDGDDVGERPIPKVLVMLADPNGYVVKMTKTDEDGEFVFVAVLPESGYKVMQVNNEGYVDVYDSDGDNLNEIIINVVHDDVTDLVFVDAMFSAAPSITPQGENATRRIEGQVQRDHDNDKDGDTGLEWEVGLVLLGPDLSIAGMTGTDEEGYFKFESLEPACCYTLYLNEYRYSGYSDVNDSDGGILNEVKIDLTYGNALEVEFVKDRNIDALSAEPVSTFVDGDAVSGEEVGGEEGEDLVMTAAAVSGLSPALEPQESASVPETPPHCPPDVNALWSAPIDGKCDAEVWENIICEYGEFYCPDCNGDEVLVGHYEFCICNEEINEWRCAVANQGSDCPTPQCEEEISVQIQPDISTRDGS